MMAAVLLWLSAGAAQANGPLEKTTLTLGAPGSAQLGRPITVQALLVDSAGRPIAHAKVVFSIPMTFLSSKGNMVIAELTTDKDGRVSAVIQNRRSGDLALRADYAGDTQYAASAVMAQIAVSGEEQLYVEDIGLHIPFFNSPPQLIFGGDVTLLGAALWPSMTGWPIAAVLIIIWSLFVLVVVRIFGIAALAGDDQTGTHAAGDQRP
jgi:hypothetical protein